MTPTTRPQLGTYFRDTVEEKENWPQIALATERFRAIDLSCRACDACGAGCWVLGLDSRWGSPLRSVFTPNLRLHTLSHTLQHTSLHALSTVLYMLQLLHRLLHKLLPITPSFRWTGRLGLEFCCGDGLAIL